MEIGVVDFFDARQGRMFGFMRVPVTGERLWFHISGGRMPVINKHQKVELAMPDEPLNHPVTGTRLMFIRGRNARGEMAQFWCFKIFYDEREETAKLIPTRRFAGMFDLRVEGPAEERGHDRSNDAIGGYYGVSWWSYFQDFHTGVLYRVRCSDGANGGQSAYTYGVEQLRNDWYVLLQEKFKRAEQTGAKEIRISRRERFLMQGFTHAALLETEMRRADGIQSKDGIEGGLVGHYHGIPVICDLTMVDEFTEQPV